MISVVLATYNGAVYINDQLESLLKQTQMADEVLICDECSTDNTVEIVNNFVQVHGLINWKVIIDKQNKGWKRNFLDLFFMAHGNYIFYCDQDDVWSSDKIENMIRAFNSNKNILCLSCRYNSIDQDGKIIEFTVDEKPQNTKMVSEINLNDRRFFVTPSGCTLAIRKDLLKYIDCNFYDVGGTDSVLCRTAALIRGFYDIDDSLMYHRFHIQNATIDISRRKCLHGSGKFIDRVNCLQGDIASLEKNFPLIKNKLLECGLETKYQDIIIFLKDRLDFLKDGNINSLFSALYKCDCHLKVILLITDVCYKLGINKYVGYLYGLYKRDISLG